MLTIVGSGADALIAAQLIDRNDTGSFGIIDTTSLGSDQVAGVRQRPAPVTEPLAVVSRLVLRPSILPLLVPRAAARSETDLGYRRRRSGPFWRQLTTGGTFGIRFDRARQQT